MSIVRTVGSMRIEIPDSERQECEVWTRVMGYYRPVRDFNIGKKSEHRERRYFGEAVRFPGGGNDVVHQE